MCIAKRNLLDISEIYAAGSAFTNHLEASLCIQPGAMEDRRILRVICRGHHQVVQVQRMILGFYRPQKDLSWAEKQAF